MPLQRASKSAKLPVYADRAPRNRTQRRELELALRDEPMFARAYAAWGRSTRRTLDVDRLAQALRSGMRPQAAALVAFPAFEARDPTPQWSRFAAELSQAYRAAVEHSGQAAADMLPGARFTFRVAKAKRSSITVPPNERSLQWIREHGGEQIRGISNEQRTFIARRIERGYARGERPEDMAQAIRRGIGLTDKQADAVERRREIAGDDAAERYADQQLDARASTIARTENKAAQSRGQQDAWTEARDEGLIPPTTRKRWVSMPESDRLSDICRELDGQIVALDEDFRSDLLGEDFPSPPAHPNCRSTVVLDFAGDS